MGNIAINDHGYGVRDPRGREYGPFTTLNEAAYAVATRADYHDPTLLGEPNADAPPAPAVDTGRLLRNRKRISTGVIASGTIVLALVAGVALSGRRADERA